MNKDKVYTYPYRKLYGEFDPIQFEQLRLDIVEGKITEQLCLIDSNDRASCIDEYGVLEYYSEDFMIVKLTTLLRKLVQAQMKKRLDERNT